MRRVTLVALIIGSLAAGCGGTADAPSRPRATVAATTTSPPFDETDVKFSQSFWHSGFHVELTRAEVWSSKTLMTNRTSYWLTLWGNFENLGDEVAAFEPEMAIEESGIAYINRSDEPPPRLLPGTTALGELTFLIPEDLDLESAEFVVGGSNEYQARVPLGAAGPATRLEPLRVEISDQVTTELLDLAVSHGVVGYDIPARHEQLEAGKTALTLHFGVTSRAPGNGKIAPEDLALLLPDGSTVAPTATAMVPVPGDVDGVTTSDLAATFVVDAGIVGPFGLQMTLPDPWLTETGDAAAVIQFSL